MSKATQEKAARFVKEKRVALFTVNEDLVAAEVRGVHSTYTVKFDPENQWSCDCPAGQHDYHCSHEIAVVIEITRRHQEGEEMV
jgi:uncharacterized Zn finger protein